MSRNVLRALGALALAGAVVQAPAAKAEAVADFYKSQLVTVIVSSGGGSYTLIARAIARHMPKYIPGEPTMIVKNMPGAGHVRATNFMYNHAPRDGSHIATIGNSIPLHQVLGRKGVRFDASRFNWLGSTGITNLMTAVWHTAGIRTIDDAKKKEVISGGTGAGSGTVIYPTLMNNVLGTKFKIVIGYRRAGNIDLAMERGEVMARSGYSYGSLSLRHPDWIKENKVTFPVMVGLDPKKGPEGVPLLVDLARNDEERKIFELFSRTVELGRPYLTTPVIPVERLVALRAAFAATLKDEGFLADQKKTKFDLYPATWDEVTDNVKAMVGTSSGIVKLATAAMTRRGLVDCARFTDPKNCRAKKKKAKK